MLPFRLSLLLCLVLTSMGRAREISAVRSFKSHAEVNAVCFSPDGKLILAGAHSASGPPSGHLTLWDATTGKALPNPLRLNKSIEAVAINADATLMAACTRGALQGPLNAPFRLERGELKLFQASTARLKFNLKGNSLEHNCVVFSPDGKILASGGSHVTARGQWLAGGVVHLWDTSNGKEITELKGHNGSVQSVAFSPDGKRLASASREVPIRPGIEGGGEVKLWDVAQKKEVATLALPRMNFWTVAFSPDGKTIAAAGKDGVVYLWDEGTAKAIAALPGHRATVISLAFSPDGRLLVSGGGDPSQTPALGELKVWDVAQKKELASLVGHRETVMSVAIDFEGRQLVSGCRAGEIKLWDLSSLRKP